MLSLLSACSLLLAISTLTFTSRLYALYRNYLTARPLNIPLIIRLESWQDPFWMLCGPPIRSLLSRLGLSDLTTTDYTSIGWPQHDRFASHAALGPAFAIITPFKTNIVIADVAAARAMFRGWRAWVKSEELYAMFNAYGRNVNSANGDDWQRHRKITAAALKEGNSRLVWGATRKQVDGVVRKWVGKHGEEITLRELRGDAETVAMHVLMSAGFGQEYVFETGVQLVEAGHRVSFGEAMRTCVGAMAVMLVPVTFAVAQLPSWVVPNGLKRLQVAVEEVQAFLRSAVEAEREALRKGVQPRDNLISTLVRANEEEKKGVHGKGLALTDDELYGNLFMFTLAGHETTSSSLSYAVPLLAVYPEVQRWIRAEVDAVAAEVGLEDYTEAYPRLVRTLALMYETQRFFSAIPMHPKYTGSQSQILKLNGSNKVIPHETFVSINYNAIHFDPALWGSDVNDFRPSRWIKGNGALGQERFGTPDGAEFLGWSFGPRACPGKRFSQVEFTAAIARLLSECEIRPARMEGESVEQARDRLRVKTFDVEHFISLQVTDPDGAGIVCVSRSDT
ncbi:cytochrome P450 [Bimuria novae-zelandiae CBS 107.79]|uniref:Cytochrome P450 n=1 Tax=Bimuria novae-zelandiae CBS 107.79 TaxID=1447943 RepID=A0A6A5UGK0_9PLEO|nr:cytochrome P450 [Bimuria novae-zelandiae CBS 107.79]